MHRDRDRLGLQEIGYYAPLKRRSEAAFSMAVTFSTEKYEFHTNEA